MRIFLAIAFLLLTGCDTYRVKAEASPYDAKIDPACFMDCPALPKWDGTIDQAPEVIHKDGLVHEMCETYRAFCRTALEALQKAKVIK